MKLRSAVGIIVIASIAMPLLSACDSYTTIEGTISRVTQVGEGAFSDGGNRFTIGDNPKTYNCFTARVNECASIRVGDKVKMTYYNDDYVSSIEYIHMGPGHIAPEPPEAQDSA